MVTKDDMRVFGENVRHLRMARRITQKELAEIMGIGVKSLRRIEQGDFPAKFDATHLYCLTEYFHVSVTALFTPVNWSE